MDRAWVVSARVLAGRIADRVQVEPEENLLTDRLIEFVFRPEDVSSACFRLLMSPAELMFFAGCGTRFELGDPDSGSSEAVRLADAVASGGLSERPRFGRIQFRVELGGGETVSGSSNPSGSETPPHGTWHRYAPYPTRPG